MTREDPLREVVRFRVERNGPGRRRTDLAASPADGAGLDVERLAVAMNTAQIDPADVDDVLTVLAEHRPYLASPADGAGEDRWYESAKRGTEQWVELFEAHNRGDDLGPIFERHVIEAGERIDAALAAPLPKETP